MRDAKEILGSSGGFCHGVSLHPNHSPCKASDDGILHSLLCPPTHGIVRSICPLPILPTFTLPFPHASYSPLSPSLLPRDGPLSTSSTRLTLRECLVQQSFDYRVNGSQLPVHKDHFPHLCHSFWCLALLHSQFYRRFHPSIHLTARDSMQHTNSNTPESYQASAASAVGHVANPLLTGLYIILTNWFQDTFKIHLHFANTIHTVYIHCRIWLQSHSVVKIRL